jgi:integrase
MRGCPALSSGQLRSTLRHLRGRYRLRDRALVLLGVHSGLRIAELLSLQVGQVWDGHRPRDRFYLPRAAGKGKTSGASLALHPRAGRALAHWLESRPAVKPRDYLFPSQRCPRQPFDRRWAWRRLGAAFRAAGVSGMTGTHCLRKTFARNVHRAMGGDLFGLSKAMRHSSPMTTLAYLSFDQERIDRAILDT